MMPKAFFFIISLVILLVGGSIGAVFILLFGIILSLLKNDFLIIALFLSFLISIANPVLFNEPVSSGVSFLRIMLLLIGASLTIYRFFKLGRSELFFLPFAVYLIVVSILSFVYSYFLTLSMMKLSFFSIGAFTTVASFNLTKKKKQYWIDFVESFYIVIVLFSVPTLFINSIGYARNGDGFQGVLNHPQTFSVVLSGYIGFWIVRWFGNRNIKNIFIFILSILFLFLSKGRTGFFSIGLTFLIMFLFSWKKFYTWIYKNRIHTIAIFFILIAVGVGFSKEIASFVLKRDNIRTVQESVEISRASQFMRLIDNINNHPYEGIGFGLPSLPSKLKGNIVYDPVFELPVSAPTEKGFLFLGVVEETGVIGSMFFYMFLYFLIVKIRKQSRLPVFVLVLVLFFCNIGEMYFFSFGGIGLFLWLLFGLGLYREAGTNAPIPVSQEKLH